MILQLSFNDFLQLRGAKGAAIEVLDGKVWITEPGRSGDLFLEAGRSYRVSGRGVVVVGADDPLHFARVLVRRQAMSLFDPLWNLIKRGIERRRTVRDLSGLTDHMLKDIDLRRDEIPYFDRRS